MTSAESFVSLGSGVRDPYIVALAIFPSEYVTGFGIIGLIADLVKIEFLPEKASTKLKYGMRKI